MKRIGNLFEKVVDIDNLRLADEKARKGKRHSFGVRLHDKAREENLRELQRQLIEGTFRTSEYSVFTIHEPKERQIYRLPYYPDRILHHAIMNVLEPIWTSVFTADTYSCIKGRGIHAAARKLKKALRTGSENCAYCLKIDITKFYPSLSHDVLKKIIRRKLKDARLLALLDEIIDSAPGLPIGNYLSQSLANLSLTYFDHWVKERLHLKHYFRYADDIVVLHKDKRHLNSVLAYIEAYLSGRLQLNVKQNKQIFPVAVNHKDKHGRGIDFLGYVFYKSETRLRKSIKQAFCRKAIKLARQKASASTFRQSVAAWWGWCKHCQSQRLIETLNEKLGNYENYFGQEAVGNTAPRKRSVLLQLQHR